MNNLYEVLEICLRDMEQGADIETVLFRYPDLAEELRPILEASAGARSMAVAAPSGELVRRNRARVLQHAAQMRETKTRSSQRFWFASLRRLAVTLAVVAILFVSGTGLVGASSDTLPGDNLYPVKRTWEGLRLFFTFDGQAREALELEHEYERLHELRELLAEGRSADVDFNGLVTSQNENEWVVAGVRVLISSETEIRDSGIVVGSAVRVRGVTQGSDTVRAERIRLLSSDAKLPEADHDSDDNNDNEDNSGPGSGDDRPKYEDEDTPELENDNSGSNTNENENSSGSDDGNDNNHDNSGSDDNSDDNGSNDNSSDDNADDSNDKGDDSSSGGDDNDNDDNSGSEGGDNSGSGGGDDDGDSGGEDNKEEDD